MRDAQIPRRSEHVVSRPSVHDCELAIAVSANLVNIFLGPFINTALPYVAERTDACVLKYLVEELKREKKARDSSDTISRGSPNPANNPWRYACIAYALRVGTVDWSDGKDPDYFESTPHLKDLAQWFVDLEEEWIASKEVMPREIMGKIATKIAWIATQDEGVEVAEEVYQQCLRHRRERMLYSLGSVEISSAEEVVAA
jgi:hypothetical protein